MRPCSPESRQAFRDHIKQVGRRRRVGYTFHRTSNINRVFEPRTELHRLAAGRKRGLDVGIRIADEDGRVEVNVKISGSLSEETRLRLATAAIFVRSVDAMVCCREKNTLQHQLLMHPSRNFFQSHSIEQSLPDRSLVGNDDHR
jgi:hypothetical protein